MGNKPNREGDLRDARDRIADYVPQASFRHVGRVARIGDGVAFVSGLPECRLDELVRFSNGTLGIAMSVSEEQVGCALLGTDNGIVAGSEVHGLGEVARVPVGDALLGRVVDPTGRPLDGGEVLANAETSAIERSAPGIIERSLVSEPLLTGIAAVDAMIPIGRGQRELIIGDRKTGKTSIALDTILNQAEGDVICVYAGIGQKSSSVAHVIDAVRRYGRSEKCVFVIGAPDAAAGLQWATPFAACAIAEYFRDRGQHALVIYDDLTKHAIVHRQLSLLLRRPPGREAYPGDVFYLHARLLERAASLSPDRGGGSLSALPIAETQGGNLTAFIPTNLVSITDGQIYLEPKLFNEGQKPAINVGLSVSRVGGKAQVGALKSLAAQLKLDYAQFLELEMFTRFGSMIDDRTKARIEHGKRIRASLRQEELAPIPLYAQVGMLLALGEGLLDTIPVDRVGRFRKGFQEALLRDCPREVAKIEETGNLTDEDKGAMLKVARRVLELGPDAPTNRTER